MSNPANNPLFKHFRQPAIYLKLPSNGRYYKDNAIDLPVTGEIPIYPMTVKDELTLKTPDALMNGAGVAEVIKSCCPNIKDPWNMPAIDLDPVFIAIRLASYGAGMDIVTICPHCQSKNEHTVDLRKTLDSIKPNEFDSAVTIDNLIFKFKPQRFQTLNQTNLIAFEEQRLINGIIQNDSLSQTEKTRLFNESFEKIRLMNIGTVAESIESITTEDGTVVVSENQIVEFLNHCSRQIYSQIKETAQKLIDQTKIPEIELACNECTQAYANTLNFDQANFFA